MSSPRVTSRQARFRVRAWCVILSRSRSGEWRNGRRAGFRCQCPSGRGGSSPPSPTRCTRARPMLMESMGLARFTRILWGRSPHARSAGFAPNPHSCVVYASGVCGVGAFRVGGAALFVVAALSGRPRWWCWGACRGSLQCGLRWSRHSLWCGAITGRPEGAVALAMKWVVGLCRWAVALAMKRCDFGGLSLFVSGGYHSAPVQGNHSQLCGGRASLWRGILHGGLMGGWTNVLVVWGGVCFQGMSGNGESGN